MPYQPIENYGVIGDMHTVALIGRNGSIDWLCLPRFDSPSVFGRILDDGKGGHFRICPLDEKAKVRQYYWPETNVLITRFLSNEGSAELTDFMPVGPAAKGLGCRHLIRRITALRGSIPFRMECLPAFDYARASHETEIVENGAVFKSADLGLSLSTRVPLKRQGSGVAARFKLEEGESATYLLRENNGAGRCEIGLSEEETETLFRATVEYWHSWLAQCRYTGRWRETVHRSALALKLMTYEPTGAIVAAPTCGLPEEIGGTRNWDYRYTWIRDSAFTIYALLRLGFKDEASAFMGFLSDKAIPSGGPGQPLQIMYGIGGETELKEEILDHLDGYQGSRPVRIGNGAHDQLQLDIYGELMDAVYLYNKWAVPVSYDQWCSLREMVDWVCDNWQRPDDGVWEVRSGRQHFVYSKMMSWVAVDRGLRLAQKRSFPASDARWLETRNKIYEEIMDRGWSRDRQAFVQSYGSDTLDAAILTMPLVFFLSPTDPRMMKTLKAILKSPEKGGLVANSLVYRYNLMEAVDGIEGEEGTFNICTFWLVEALTRAGRFDPKRLEEARLIFEGMLGFANHLGLYAEETGKTGEALGNFPQAFTHLALISAAFNLDRALDARE